MVLQPVCLTHETCAAAVCGVHAHRAARSCARSAAPGVPQGMLQDDWASWPHLRFLSLGDPVESIVSTLPEAWGYEGAFPKLATL